MTAYGPRALRVLVVARREPWPLNSGGRLRLYNFLKHLVRDAAVTLVLPEEPVDVAHLPDGLRVVNTAAAPYALREGESRRAGTAEPAWITQRARRHFGYCRPLFRWLEANAQPARFDVALLFGAVAGQYIDAVHIPAVWDAVDELVLYTVRDAGRRGVGRWPRTARAAALYAMLERHVAQKAHATIFASPVDASYARRWAGGAAVESISNGVDFDYFRGPTQASEPGTVAFVGSLSFPPNVEGIVRFATRIWPRVQSGAANRRLLIVGREPAAAVRALGQLPGVALHADVPDVRPYLARAAAVVVPTQLGGGVKNKVLEACAMRRAVVAGPRALAGLSARPGVDVLCASDEADWRRHLTRLLERREFAAQIASNGYEWVRQAHDWSRLTGRLRDVLSDAAVGAAAAV
jgi:glycosyltransferase involved in cell wall biosynthesis